MRAVAHSTVWGSSQLRRQEPQVQSYAAFLCPCALLWVARAGSRKARQCLTGLLTRPNPTRPLSRGFTMRHIA
jgi:hypothetical protein